MNRTLRLAFAACAFAVLLASCSAQDVTSDAMQRDIATVYKNQLVRREHLLGNEIRNVSVDATCYRGGPQQADVGPGKDWRCDLHTTDDSGPRDDVSYLVNARTNACWTALVESLAADAAAVDVTTMTDPRSGTVLTDPTGSFDGCLPA